MHHRRHLLRPARAHEVGLPVVDHADFLKGLGADRDHRDGIETRGPVDGEVADHFLSLFRCRSVFDERETGYCLAFAQDAGLEFDPRVRDQDFFGEPIAEPDPAGDDRSNLGAHFLDSCIFQIDRDHLGRVSSSAC